MLKRPGFIGLAAFAALGINCSCAIADTIDQQYQEFISRFNVAKNSKQISSKQASEIDRDLHEFNRTKRSMRETHADVVTADDELKLNGMLNDCAQKLETMQANHEVPVEKPKPAKKKEK